MTGLPLPWSRAVDGEWQYRNHETVFSLIRIELVGLVTMGHTHQKRFELFVFQITQTRREEVMEPHSEYKEFHGDRNIRDLRKISAHDLDTVIRY